MFEQGLVIFSDLDGTLLDHRNYSLEAARPALNWIEQSGIPLIFCTSKTRRETEWWRQQIGNRHPFIVENGAAIYIPSGYFPFPASQAINMADYQVLVLGQKYEVLREFLVSFRDRHDPSIRGFGDMTGEEIASLCNLPLEMAEMASRREYDEPFIGGNEKSLRLLEKEAAASGLHLLGGSRFHHLTGANDKGRAVRMMMDLYSRIWPGVKSIALGDSHNDEAMLAEVETAFLVQRPDGSYDERIKVPRLHYIQGIGPAGWNRAILEFLFQPGKR